MDTSARSELDIIVKRLYPLHSRRRYKRVSPTKAAALILTSLHNKMSSTARTSIAQQAANNAKIMHYSTRTSNKGPHRLCRHLAVLLGCWCKALLLLW